jgi:hypothetical protein
MKASPHATAMCLIELRDADCREAIKAIFMRFSATSVEPGRRQRKSYRKPSTRSANRVEASGMR